MSIKNALEAVEGERLDLLSKKELLTAVETLDIAHRMSKSHLEVLKHCESEGPLWDGDVISKSHRTDLCEVGAIAKVSVKGEQGFNACTYYGRALIRALEFYHGSAEDTDNG